MAENIDKQQFVRYNMHGAKLHRAFILGIYLTISIDAWERNKFLFAAGDKKPAALCPKGGTEQ